MNRVLISVLPYLLGPVHPLVGPAGQVLPPSPSTGPGRGSSHVGRADRLAERLRRQPPVATAHQHAWWYEHCAARRAAGPEAHHCAPSRRSAGPGQGVTRATNRGQHPVSDPSSLLVARVLARCTRAGQWSTGRASRSRCYAPVTLRSTEATVAASTRSHCSSAGCRTPIYVLQGAAGGYCGSRSSRSRTCDLLRACDDTGDRRAKAENGPQLVCVSARETGTEGSGLPVTRKSVSCQRRVIPASRDPWSGCAAVGVPQQASNSSRVSRRVADVGRPGGPAKRSPGVRVRPVTGPEPGHHRVDRVRWAGRLRCGR